MYSRPGSHSRSPQVEQFDIAAVFLRSYTFDDFEEFAAIVTDLQLMQHLDGPLSMADATTLLRRCISPGKSDPLAWAVIDKQTQGIVGHAALKTGSEPHSRELIIVLKSRIQGRGLGKTIGRALCDIAFCRPDVEAIIATLDPDHEAAAVIAKSIGMSLHTTERDSKGEYPVYRVTREEWNRTSSPSR